MGRTKKPFNPLLGETYELVTPKFRYFSELLCHHPPIVGMECEGQGWKFFKILENTLKFNGKSILINDKDRTTSIELYIPSDDGKI
jgi:hypothetical protein